MNCILLLVSLLFGRLCNAGSAQRNQASVMPQSTSTTDMRQAHPARSRMKAADRQERLKREAGVDTTLPKNRRQRRLPPDSLRRGGATRVDTVRR